MLRLSNDYLSVVFLLSKTRNDRSSAEEHFGKPIIERDAHRNVKWECDTQRGRQVEGGIGLR
jgi:hypothetical protein